MKAHRLPAIVLYLIGLGLHDVRDITVKGLQAARSCDRLFAEFYTAILQDSHDELQEFIGRPVSLLERSGVEEEGGKLIEAAKTRDIGLLTAGDPLTATTHAELVHRARLGGVQVHVVHAPSILTAAPGVLGLQHYKFGRTVTLARPEEGWFPTSPLAGILKNREAGLHSLVLLDIKSDEGYFMSANEGLQLLLRMADETGNSYPTKDSQAAVIARAGGDCIVRTGRLASLEQMDFGPPLHSIVLPGELHVAEEEAWQQVAA